MASLTQWSFLCLFVCMLVAVPPAATSFANDEETSGSKSATATAEESEAGKFEVPDGTPEKLFQFINRIKRMRPAERTQEATIAHLKKQVAAVIVAADKVLAQEISEAEALRAVEEKFGGLSVLSRVDDKADQQLMELAKALQNDPRPGVVHAAGFQLLQQGIMETMRKTGNADAVEGLIFTFIEKNGLDTAIIGLIFQLGEELGEYEDEKDVARTLLTRLVVVMEKSEDAKILDRLPEVAAKARRLDLPGNFMELSGITAEGREFDWKSYRGSFVLVDFWATWCGPCVAEIPNVKKNLERYGEKGFKVVGVNLDQNRDEFDAFMEEAQLPWQNIVPDKNGKSAMADYYAISGIPTVILVDREGKVVSDNARGNELGRLLETHLGGDDRKDDTR